MIIDASYVKTYGNTRSVCSCDEYKSIIFDDNCEKVTEDLALYIFC